jgi:CBS-domain-containing membrane protein
MLHLRSFGPAVSHISPVEAMRAGLGAFIGLSLAGALVLSPMIDLHLGLYLVAPFGATCQRQSKSEPKGSAKCCHFGVGMIAA